jgi:AraC-like DNA-binding protein
MAGSLAFSEDDGILYGSGSIDGRVSLVGPLSEKRITVGIGLAFPGGARHWHRDVPTGGVGIFLAGDEHDARYSAGACYATATLTEERLEDDAARCDLVLDRRALGGTRIHARPASEAVVQSLHRRVMAVHAGSDGDRCLGPDFLSAIVAHCAREPRTNAGTGRRPDHGLIVRRARAYIADHLDEPISLDSVAAAARTSRRTLTRAFCALVEESPTLYARRLRLHRIRHDLVSPEEAVTSIAIIAAKWGAGEPGRVSGWYRDLFDELPSETRAAYRQRVSRRSPTLARSA